MARRGERRPRILPGDPSDADGLWVWTHRYLENLRIRSYTSQTVRGRERALGWFLTWCVERGLRQPREITRPVLLRYQRHLFEYRKADRAPLTPGSQNVRLVAIRAWFQWLTREGVLLSNPASELELPRLGKHLPAVILTPAEVEVILRRPRLGTPLGIRDRAILELLYSTGMRRMELAGLEVPDVDPTRGTVTIRQGKGKKDRVVPVGERALVWVHRYRLEVRPCLLTRPSERALFLTHLGDPFTLNGLTTLVRRHVMAADLGKTGGCHLFRHAMATSMLENGADIRHLQEILGHESLGTTQIYTQVSIRKLKEVHEATHPAAWLPVPEEGRDDPGEDRAGGVEAPDEATNDADRDGEADGEDTSG